MKALTDVSEQAIDAVGSSMWTKESDAVSGQSCGVLRAATWGPEEEEPSHHSVM